MVIKFQQFSPLSKVYLKENFYFQVERSRTFVDTLLQQLSITVMKLN